MNGFESMEKFRPTKVLGDTMQKEINELQSPNLDEKTEILRSKILSHLSQLGFVISNGGSLSLPEDKNYIRNAHKAALGILIKKNFDKIQKYDQGYIDRYIIDGRDLDVASIEPRLIKVNDSNTNLFNWVKLHWSIPISAGYGRRLRYIVTDKANGSIIGIIGLADPVYGLRDRDSLIGWSPEMRKVRLKNIMDAFVLGSVPPYSQVLGGKLIASLLASPKIRQDFIKKYKGTKSLISGTVFDGKLAAITTASAFGKSSVYDRISIRNGPRFIHTGWSSGSGEFHMFSEIYPELLELVREDVKSRKNPLWGKGIRNRRVVILAALDRLHLPRSLLYHNVKRELFTMPLGSSSFEYLKGISSRINYYPLKQEEIADYIIERWMIPRAKRDGRYLQFEKETFSLRSMEKNQRL